MQDDFDDWVRWVFDHPVAGPSQMPWYSTPGAVMCDVESEPGRTLSYVTRLFRDPQILIGRYSADQIGQGLWFLADPSCSSHLLAFVRPDIAWAARKRAIDSVHTLYERLFQRVCDATLGHLATASQPGNRANQVCYMFWDVSPLGPRGEDARQHDLACLDVMRRTLAIPHPACQEGALHGLGHWRALYPEPVDTAIAGYLAQSDNAVPAELRAYASRQRCS